MRFLGIDYGEKRVGLALSDENGKLAFPFKILKNSSMLLEEVHNICGEENITEIVIGESFDLFGEPNALMDKILKFRNDLEKLNLPIHFEREFMTSLHADSPKTKDIFSARKNKKSINSKNDASSAVLILQRFLDRRSHRA